MPFEKGKSGNENCKFKKGQSGNPDGRPKKLPPLDDLLAEVLTEGDEDGIEAARGILMTLRKNALKGDTKAAEMLLDRAYGKVKQTIENEHKGGIGVKVAPMSKEDIRRINEALEGEY